MNFRVDSPRLYIRPWETTDRPMFARFVHDADMMRYIGRGRAWDEARIDAMFERQVMQLAGHGCCMGALVLKETDQLSGVAGIQPLGETGLFELGWWIWKDYWNRGLATEAALALKGYAFQVLELSQIVAIAEIPNKASIRVMEKIGMRYEGIRNAHELVERYTDMEVVYYVLDNPQKGNPRS